MCFVPKKHLRNVMIVHWRVFMLAVQLFEKNAAKKRARIHRSIWQKGQRGRAEMRGGAYIMRRRVLNEEIPPLTVISGVKQIR
jgi:hypothetical protein